MKAAPVCCSIALLFTYHLRADEPPAAPGASSAEAGHSAHGEAFNEGPRQRAVLMEGTGNIQFPITAKTPEAQQFFTQGVGQLHGFWYFEAERSFRQVATLDPDCAMAFWGMAMANVNNPKRAKEFISKAVALRSKVSRREQLWIDSLADYFGDGQRDAKTRRQALIKALEKIAFEFPEDLEAKAFAVFWIWDSKDKGLPIVSYAALDALASQVLAANPMHPVHHYRIHFWNFEDDQRALNSAALCGQAAPAIAHMWHMPGHTFTKLHRYADAAWQQEASARVDHAHIVETRILPEQIHNYAHNNDWLVEDLEYIGRVRDAWDLAKNMIELPRLAPNSTLVGRGGSYDGARSGFSMGRNRLMETALNFELWSELTALDGTTYLSPSDEPADEVNRLRCLAIAWFGRTDSANGNKYMSALEAELKKAREARIAAADEAETAAKKGKKSAEETAKAMADALQRFSTRIATNEAALAEARLYGALAQGNEKEARAQLGLSRDLSLDRKARVLAQLGDYPAAITSARDAVKKADGQILPLAVLTDVEWRGGKKAEALGDFAKLRALAAQSDLSVAVFSRLAAVAQEAGIAGDWRPRPGFPKDSGNRPELSKLGPFRWQPYKAADWILPDQNGQQISLAEYRGKPVLVMFYLGSGCSHCIEQLNLFAPEARAYADAGITLLAVSTDTQESLHKTFEKATAADGFSFPILADPTLGAFKAYRSFDDFENIPLHGTFLIDGAGLVRWQDISYEPFRNPKWLLAEAKRLLTFPVSEAQQSAASLPTDGAAVETTSLP